MDNINIDNRQFIKNQSSSTRGTTMYDITKARYDAFVFNIEKSDMKNAYTRYLTEYSMLEKLKEHAQESQSKEVIDKVQAQIDYVEEVLSERFGIVFSKE